MTHPYQNLPNRSFWSTAIAQRNRFEIDELWQPKFKVSKATQIATFGSCFAQHFGRALRKRDFGWLNTEATPLGLSAASAEEFNYNVFSCRTGNIYTTSLLLQWATWASDPSTTPDEYWSDGERVYDPFRPTIEPGGFGSIEEARASRLQTIESFRNAIRKSNIFVFTLGLTESWMDTRGWEYPVCPGTAAGEFEPEHHQFVNQTYRDIRKALLAAIKLMKTINPKLRFLLTVSPVPLTATKTDKHVLVGTMQSKSTLRAVAGELADSSTAIDYFPSYEIINSPVFGGTFFEPNQRNVSAYGVDFVMSQFFKSIGAGPQQVVKKKPAAVRAQQQDAKCDEELLDAFSPAAS